MSCYSQSTDVLSLLLRSCYLGSADNCDVVQLYLCQVKLVDPVDERGCEVEWRYTEDGERVRVSRRSGRILPIPEVAKATADYMAPESYTAGPKDTDAGKVILVTYAPKLMTVEDDILDSVGIVETKKRGKTYWY